MSAEVINLHGITKVIASTLIESKENRKMGRVNPYGQPAEQLPGSPVMRTASPVHATQRGTRAMNCTVG
jgi:hypothetical protein